MHRSWFEWFLKNRRTVIIVGTHFQCNDTTSDRWWSFFHVVNRVFSTRWDGYSSPLYCFTSRTTIKFLLWISQCDFDASRDKALLESACQLEISIALIFAVHFVSFVWWAETQSIAAEYKRCDNLSGSVFETGKQMAAARLAQEKSNDVSHRWHDNHCP